MANIKLKSLITEAEDFQARSKETGKLVHFKSKDAYQSALKAGTHEDPNAKKGGASKGAAKPNDMFGGDYAKDRGGEAPKPDSMATVNSIAAKTGLRAQAVAGWADENGVNLSKVSADIDSKKLKPMDFMTAVSGNPGNKYAKDIVAKYSQSASPKADLGVDKVVYNTRTKTVGIVRMADERGETKTDADGNVNTSELEPYNPMKYPHQKDAKVAPSTQKEVDARGLWNPFSQSGSEAPKDSNDKGDDGFGWGPENDRTPATSLPKKASQLNYKHAEVLEKALNAEAGLGGYVDTDDNTDAIMFTASSGMAPTYTLYFGGNDDYGKPDEFRVSLLSTYGNDPSNIGDSIDKSFKTAEEAMAFAKQVAKKYKKELEMDDDTNESTKLKSMFRK